VVNLVEKSESSFSRRAWFGALLPLAQNLEQMALDVGSLPPSQLLGVNGVEQLLLDAPVAIDGAKARRDHGALCVCDHKSECSRLEVLKVRERTGRAWWELSRTGETTLPRGAHTHIKRNPS